MAAMELLSTLLEINLSKFSKQEIKLIEAVIFAEICNALKENFRRQNKSYLSLIKYSINEENKMLDEMFIRWILNDILSTNEYSLNGIAYYANLHEDVIQDVIDGRNINPSAALLRKSIELHRIIRKDFYKELARKIAIELINPDGADSKVNTKQQQPFSTGYGL